MAIERTGGVDAAIDDAARAMTEAAPPSLRLAVSKRVSVPLGLRPTVTPWLGAAAAAIVVVVAAALWMSGPSPVSTPATGGMPVTTAANPAPIGAAAVASPPVVRAATPASVVRRDSSVTQRTAARTVPPSTIELTEVAIVPLSTEAVVVELVPAPEAIEITPIAVAPLAIGMAGDALEE